MSNTPKRLENFASIQRLGNFGAVGNGICLSVTTSSATTQFPTLPDGNEANDVMIVNTGTGLAFVAFGGSTVTAMAPVSGTPANGIAIPAGAVMVLDKNTSTYIAAIGAATTTLYIYQGMGS